MYKKIMLRRMAHSAQFIIGSLITILLVLLAIFCYKIAPHEPNVANLAVRLTAPQWFSNGAQGYILGTDNLGRDVFSRMIIGTRVSLIVSLASTSIMIVFGTGLGIIAGYRGGVIDNIIMRCTEVTMAVPTLTMGIVIMAVFGASIVNLIVVMVVCSWISFARIARNEVMVIKNKEFVQASRALGAKSFTIMFKQIFPNITTPLIIQASSTFGTVILVESALSYLYLGIQAPNPSWGNMISDGRNYLATAPWLVIAPGVALMIAVLGFNFLGDGLRDILDPKQSR